MLLAKIREEDCVGCAKCLPACPVDAIIGAPQFLHTVLIEACIGCGLCVAPCPVDCIDMVESTISDGSEIKKQTALNAKKRYIARQERLIRSEQPKLLSQDPEDKFQIRQEIKEACNRVKEKRDKNA